MTELLPETSLLGALCIDPLPVLRDVRPILRAADIQDPRVRAAYKSACELADEGGVVDPVTLQTRSERNGERLDGESMRDAMQTVLTAANAKYYAEAIHEAAVRRELRSIGLSMAHEDGTPQQAIRDAVARLQALQTGASSGLKTPTEMCLEFADYLQEMADGKRQAFVSTGYRRLDAALGGGLSVGGVTTLAARTGVGKSVLAMCIADNVAKRGIPVLYVSLEMPREQLMARRAGRGSGVSYNQIQGGTIPKTDKDAWRRVMLAISELAELPLQIHDKPSTLSDIELVARSVPNLGLLVIDHMGLVKPESRYFRLTEQVSEVSHQIKSMALSMRIPILSLCQLNRESEGRQDKRPALADLRNSGAVEEDSDAVVLLFRPAMFEAEPPKPWEAQELDVQIAKNRHGCQGQVTLNFYGLQSSVSE